MAAGIEVIGALRLYSAEFTICSVLTHSERSLLTISLMSLVCEVGLAIAAESC